MKDLLASLARLTQALEKQAAEQAQTNALLREVLALEHETMEAEADPESLPTLDLSGGVKGSIVRLQGKQ